MLTISKLDFSYDSKVVFSGLDLHVGRAEHVVIVGDSGGGKSTLLRLIADGNRNAISMAPQTTSTMVLQEGALLDHLTVIDNLRLIARYSNASITESDIVETLDLSLIHI